MPQDTAPTIPRVPPALAAALGLLPRTPVALALERTVRRIAAAHPGLIRRLGPHDRARFVLDPTDLPFVICLEPNGGDVRVGVCGRPGQGTTRIAGPLAALLGLVHGAYDGDALFFSRDLVIEGDTAAALALRNAVDDAEIDLSGEIARLSGPFAGPVRRLAGVTERMTGVSLSRPEEIGAW